MVLKEVAVYKIVDNFGNNGWVWLRFWHNMDAYKGHLWCELQLPASLIVGVIANCVFLTLCQICSYRCTMGTIDIIRFENLNFNGWTLFWLGLDGIEAKRLDLYRFMQWSWKELKWSWKNHICPYFDCVACNFNKNRSNGLERKARSSPFAMWKLYQSKNGCFVQGNDLTDCLWLGIH